ncbi:MAG: tyrosine-type recombinase/integrase [archaeon]
MAEEDIYGNKARYERFAENLEEILEEPTEQGRGKRKYWCKNKANLKHYRTLTRKFEVDDTSYIRRLKLMSILKMLTHHISCDLKDVNGMDKDNIIIELRKGISPSNLRKTERDVRTIGKILFGEKQPKFFKEFEIKTDVSRQTARKDKLNFEELDRIMKFFGGDEMMQAYLSLSFESLARPQELSYLKLKDVELQDAYAVIQVSEHGKEGVKKLLSIDSFPYLVRWLKAHPNKDKSSFLFLNKHNKQLTPYAVNKRLKQACRNLKIDKPITCYSLKRGGVTFRRLIGDSDVEIQRIAGWKTTQQLKTYDLSDQQDVFKRQLIKRGLLKDDKIRIEAPKSKPCQFCGELIGFSDDICPKCLHILKKDMVKERIKKDEELIAFIDGIQELKQTHPEVFEALVGLGEKKVEAMKEIEKKKGLSPS